jgi:general secretion pathway protein M
MTLVKDSIERLEIRVLESTLGQRALAWYRRLPDRDQFLFNILSVCGLALLIIVSLLLPASRYAINSVNAYQQARGDYQWLLDNEQAALKVAAASAKPVDANSLLSTAESSAQAFGLEFKRYEPTADGDLRIWLEKAQFESLVSWLQDIASRYQLNVDSIAVSPEANHNGLVNVRLEIKG